MSPRTNTAKTVAGFLGSVFARYLPVFSRSGALTDVYNYLPVKDVYATSGQPSEKQFKLISDRGYDSVINLAPTSMLENSLVEEQRILSELGVEYTHIPVDFKNPTEDDFEQFVARVRDLDPEKLWVHCAANMRVSAFTYRYRRKVLGHDEAAALNDLHQIWEPFGVWQDFIQR